MLVSVLVNNFNYGRFLKECIDSVLNQTYENFELIIVDDGSVDDSCEILDTYAKLDSRIKIIKKTNGGQLSAFNAGFLASSGEIIFFLDADDVYYKNYLSYACSFYEEHKNIDMLSVSLKRFGNDNSIVGGTNKDLGYAVCRAYFFEDDLGYSYPTSCHSIRRSILEKILPLNLELDWRICADHTLVLGAALAGARKYLSNQIMVGYRAHGNNAFFGNDHNFYGGIENHYKFLLRNNRLIKTLADQLKINIDVSFVYNEYKLCPSINKLTFESYQNILEKLELPYFKKLKLMRRMKKRYKRVGSKPHTEIFDHPAIYHQA